MNVSLIVVRGKPQGVEIPLRIPKFLIGRGNECHLRPNSELVSRLHSVFIIEGDEVRLRDLGSTNGTLVNGQRIEGEVMLFSDDIVQIGPLAFRVVIKEAAPAQQPEPALEGTEAQKAGGMLGSEQATEQQVQQYLMGDSKHGVPSSGSEVYADDTQMLANMDTTAERPEGQQDEQEQPAEQGSDEEAVETASGRKMKVGGMKAKIEKTREDTSRAAAEILRKMMERRR